MIYFLLVIQKTVFENIKNLKIGKNHIFKLSFLNIHVWYKCLVFINEFLWSYWIDIENFEENIFFVQCDVYYLPPLDGQVVVFCLLMLISNFQIRISDMDKP